MSKRDFFDLGLIKTRNSDVTVAHNARHVTYHCLNYCLASCSFERLHPRVAVESFFVVRWQIWRRNSRLHRCNVSIVYWIFYEIVCCGSWWQRTFRSGWDPAPMRNATLNCMHFIEWLTGRSWPWDKCSRHSSQVLWVACRQCCCCFKTEWRGQLTARVCCQIRL